MTPQPVILKIFSQLFPVGKKIHGEILPETWSVTILKKCGSLSNPIKITSYRDTFTFESCQTFKIPLNSCGNSYRIFFIYNVIAFVGNSREIYKMTAKPSI